MIDRATGALRFNDGVVIDPTLTRAQFLQMRPGETCDVSVRNEPWCSWRVTRLTSGGRVFIAVVQFRGEELQSVELVESDLVGFGDWKDWSEARELEDQRRYAIFLSSELGSRRSFPWGTTSAIYDARSGGSFIKISYRDSDVTSASPQLLVVGLLTFFGSIVAALTDHDILGGTLLCLAIALVGIYVVRR
ncbi:MAG TPA: hypothetical protein VHC20_08300 [Candidatus Paceibacterota bacterium]|nr:hypothetical protein [Candidatus Paceibacterota bacterium]